MTITYNDVITNAQSKDCSAREFRDIMWQYVEDKMKGILKFGNIDVNFVKTLVNYRGNSYGAHAMLLDMAPFKNLYENVSWFIHEYAEAHEDSYKDICYRCGFEDEMNAYAIARKTKKGIEEEIRNNPLIENLCKNGHHTFAQKAIRFLANGDERTKEARKIQRESLHEMRAYDFFETLEKVVAELGE